MVICDEGGAGSGGREGSGARMEEPRWTNPIVIDNVRACAGWLRGCRHRRVLR